MITKETFDTYEMTIGIECHVQLRTVSKLFSGADNDARGKEPNAVVSPIDFGLPGMLPVLNEEAVNLAIVAGHALNADIATMSRFDRKHYFYPDLPKGYQISQMYHPTILAGRVDVPMAEGDFSVRINHAHIEEDAGKLVHNAGWSGVDLNRAGTPLIEIVSEPDMHSAAQAKAFVQELYALMTYARVTDGDLYHGNMRFDVNISVAKKGSDVLGTRAEVKNLNSFRSVERAALYEFERQVELLEKGERVVQETRGWSEAKGRTSSQRSKENAQDYRYMPDADIPPIILTKEKIEAVRAVMPILPPALRLQLAELGLDETVMTGLIASREYAIIVSGILAAGEKDAARRVALWFQSVNNSGDDNEPGAAAAKTDVSIASYVELSKMVEANELNSTAAKEVFAIMLEDGRSPRSIAEEKNLLQVSDTGFIVDVVATVLADPASAKAVEDIRAGNEKVIGFLVGQVMKQSRGKANPGMASTEIRKQLGL